MAQSIVFKTGSAPFAYVLYSNPASQLSISEKTHLHDELRSFTSQSLSVIPDYQVLSLDVDAAFENKVLALAYDTQFYPRRLAGFAAAVWFDISGVPTRVLHTGLVLIGPEYRGNHLPHELERRVVHHTITVYPGGHWITNLSNTLKALGLFSLTTCQSYPSPTPWAAPSPTTTHLRIARWMDAHARRQLYIAPSVLFDEQAFVFRDSCLGTEFKKEDSDKTCEHRNPSFNAFFRRLISRNSGDEVLQVGFIEPGHLAKVMTSQGFTALKHMDSTVM